jgi:GT2 family glycosyltransferase
MMISGSLVLYKNNSEQYTKAIKSFLNGCDGVLIIVDNSPLALNNDIFMHERIRYHHSDTNVGFGAAHNKAVAAIDELSKFHLILNPDIIFAKEVIPHLVAVMQSKPEIGVIMPRINYPDGSLQRLCKLLPTPVDLILRRFIPIKSLQNRINYRYELHDLPQDKLIDVPSLSGCFLMVRTNLFRNIGGFDEQFFMYLEDVDLVRRIGDVARVVYYPLVNITHEYARGSYRNIKLLSYHMKSALRYFTKWGWWLDLERENRNFAIIEELQKSSSRP